jgi:hypothetical protein
MSTNPDIPRRSIQRVDERRKQVFLETLRQTGSLRWAATIASPHLAGDPARDPRRGGKGHGFESFRDAMRRDPVFAAEVEAALAHALGTAEKLLAERMLTPDTRPIVDKNGNVVAVATDHRNANALLLRFLERHDPGWAPRKNVSGEIAHQHQHTHELAAAEPGYTITARDIRALPEDKQRLLLSLLDEIEDNKETADARVVATVPARPALPPAQP